MLLVFLVQGQRGCKYRLIPSQSSGTARRGAAKNSPINAGHPSCFIALLSALACFCPQAVLKLILNI